MRTVGFLVMGLLMVASLGRAEGDMSPAKRCPVTGQPAEDSQTFVEHEGKRYELCCAACVDAFYKDPKKYVSQVTPQDTCMNVDLPCTADSQS